MTHGNIVSDLSSIRNLLASAKSIEVTANDVVLSYLPLAHVFERVACNCFVGAGARVGFFQGDALKLLDDLAELRPTYFVSVPRLYNRIYDKVLAGVKAKGGLAQTLFNAGFEAKKKGLKNGNLTHWLWE